MIKKLKGMLKSKTMWFSGLLMVFGAISDNSDKLQGLLDAHTYNIIMLIVGVAVAALRFVTTQPLDNK
jgi:hypothetical protein